MGDRPEAPGVVVRWDDDEGLGDIEVEGYGLVRASFSVIATLASGCRSLAPGQRVVATPNPRPLGDTIDAAGPRWVADRVALL